MSARANADARPFFLASHRDGIALALTALAARLAVVAWAHDKFPAVEDGRYYDTLARRLASGQGYTWLWPDGAVTYAAHYPVGYPAALAVSYAIAGASPLVAMLFSAALGAAATFAVHGLLASATTRPRAAIGAAIFALHPALLAYTPAVMTEGVTTYLLAIASWLASRSRDRDDAHDAHDVDASPRARVSWMWRIAAALVLGAATLVRPQTLLLAPAIGYLAVRADLRRRIASALLVTSLAVACCVPWTLRNCARMDRCALVSMNAGWNLLIGARTTSGGWTPVEPPPPECREVWSEAAKDVCFERAARGEIGQSPGAWIARVPAKLAATFDYFGAAPWYLHASNPIAFDARAKTALGAVETVASRALLLVALAVAARLAGERRKLRVALAFAGALAALTLHAWIAYVLLAVIVAVLGRRRLEAAPMLVPLTALVIVATAVTHGVFFGAGRYGLVVVPFVTALAFVDARAGRSARAAPIPPLASESRTSSASSGSSSRASAARSSPSEVGDERRASALY